MNSVLLAATVDETLVSLLRALTESFFSWISSFAINDVVAKFQNPANNVVASIESGSLSNIMDAFIPVGICMAMIYLSKEFFEKTTLKNIDLEQIFKLFIKLVIAVALINNIKPLIVGFNEFSNVLTDQMSTVLATSTDIESVWDRVQDATNFGENSFDKVTHMNDVGGTYLTYALELVSSVLRLFVMLVYGIAIAAAGLSRSITIGYQAMYAPIAASNIVGFSTRNAAISFLKRYFAVFMQMPIAYLGVFLAINASNALISSHPVVALVVFCMGVPWVIGSSNLSKQLFA